MTIRTFAAAAAASIALTAPATAQETFEMTSAFGKNLPFLGTAAVVFTEKLNSITEDVEFEHFDPGELVPALEALDAVSNGSVDAAYTTAGYWQGKIPAASLFAAVPFGPEAGEFLGWMMYDDGTELFQRMYDEAGYNVHVIPCGIIAPETSGWFKNEINSVSDIFPALERGAIDATEFSMPRIDARLGFHNIAKYNYFPGWHQPATLFELLINKDRWEDLDEISQNQIAIACMANITDNYAEGEATNFAAMQDNVENNGVTIKQWSPEMLEAFETAWDEVAAELASEDEYFAEVWADLQEFRAGYKVWNNNIYLPRPRN